MISPGHPVAIRNFQLHRALGRVALVAFALFSAGCVQLAEVNSTHAPIYASMIGRAYELKEDFYAHGIKRPDQKSPEPEYILIMPPPRIRNHLTLDLGRVPAGSRFKIVGVITRRSKLFSSTVYSIAFDAPAALHTVSQTVRINATTPSWSLYVKPTSAKEALQLNEHYFLPIGGQATK